MAEDPTPRNIVDNLLRGVPPPRPLFLPIVFSLGAKMENLPRQTYFQNPTKIFNSARQIRSHLGSDGLSCYFDSYLEAEALGGILEWTGNSRPVLRWPRQSERGQLPEGIKTVEDAMKADRVGVALEVIRRLRSITRDGSLLTAGVTGPFTLAARLARLDAAPQLHASECPEPLLEIAASMMAQLSRAVVEAGADVVFIQEEAIPSATAADCENWSSLLGPTINIIRFYGCLPVLNIVPSLAAADLCDFILQLQPQSEMVISASMDEHLVRSIALSAGGLVGVLLTPGLLDPSRSSDEALDGLLDAISSLKPALVTTAEDLDWGADTRRLKRVSYRLRSGQTA